ncbi:hypothetical protein T492DRAFT_967603 [Pavlovales sp. CCMP2436]|nr:hypothetical protein T492DRAFT_967603 [Pavlovales sp. CCMP2436]
MQVLLIASLALVSSLHRHPRAPGAALQLRSSAQRCASASRPRAQTRSLILLPELSAEAGLPEGVVIGAVEESDLGAVGNLLVGAFYPELVTLSLGLSQLERALLETPVAWINNLIALYLADSVRSFIRRRVGGERLQAHSRSAALSTPRLRAGTTEGSSIALAAADVATGKLLAFVELTVRPLDGRVPSDMLDDVDAMLRFVLPPADPLCSYLCNLCVAPHSRRRGIGSALVLASQKVVGPSGWGHDALYLHVAAQDVPTARLYQSLGFEALRHYDPKPWQVKFLGSPHVTFHRRWLPSQADAQQAAVP